MDDQQFKSAVMIALLAAGIFALVAGINEPIWLWASGFAFGALAAMATRGN